MRHTSTTTGTGQRDWEGLRERAVELAAEALRRDGIAFDRLHPVWSSDPRYDALVEIWHRRHARLMGVRLAERDAGRPAPGGPA